MVHQPLMDTGLTAVGMLFGALWAVLGLVVVVLLEGLLLRRYLHTTWWRSLWYSIVTNLASGILGVPVIFALVRILPIPLVILLAYIVTVPVELVCLRLLFKATVPTAAILRFVVFANLASYLCVLVLPWAVMTIGMLRGA